MKEKGNYSHFFSLTSNPHLHRAAHTPTLRSTIPAHGASWSLLCYSLSFSRLIAPCHLLHFLAKYPDPHGILMIAFAEHICFHETEQLSICQSHCICLVPPFTILLLPTSLMFSFCCCLKMQVMKQHCHISGISSNTTGQQSVCLFMLTIPNGLSSRSR